MATSLANTHHFNFNFILKYLKESYMYMETFKQKLSVPRQALNEIRCPKVSTDI